jgi:acyl-CoA reductase-like NAD-dependent aldehyde dehydrogenase
MHLLIEDIDMSLIRDLKLAAEYCDKYTVEELAEYLSQAWKALEEQEGRLAKLYALENGGVDNWDGYDFAMEELRGEDEEE